MKKTRYILKTLEFRPSLVGLPWVNEYQTVELAGMALDGKTALIILQTGEFAEVGIDTIYETRN